MTIQLILIGIIISAIAGFMARSLTGRAAQLVQVRIPVLRKTRKQ